MQATSQFTNKKLLFPEITAVIAYNLLDKSAFFKAGCS